MLTKSFVAAVSAAVAVADPLTFINEVDPLELYTPMYTPVVGQTQGFVNDSFYAYLDFAVGIFWGVFSPLREFTSDDDCMSQFIMMGNHLMKQSPYFNTGIIFSGPVSYLAFTFDILLTGLNSYSLVHNCRYELAVAKETKWYENYNLATDFENAGQFNELIRLMQENAETAEEDAESVEGEEEYDDTFMMREDTHADEHFADDDALKRTIKISKSSLRIALGVRSVIKQLNSGIYYFLAGYSLGDTITTSFLLFDYLTESGYVESMKTYQRYYDEDFAAEARAAKELKDAEAEAAQEAQAEGDAEFTSTD